MPHRRVIGGVSVVVLLAVGFSIVSSTLAIGNALSIRDNCRRLAAHNDRTRAVLEDNLSIIERGDIDDDYRRIYGHEAQEKKQEAIDRLNIQIDRFGEIDCTITIIRWVKGD
jgi:hypothetical protein